MHYKENRNKKNKSRITSGLFLLSKEVVMGLANVAATIHAKMCDDSGFGYS